MIESRQGLLKDSYGGRTRPGCLGFPQEEDALATTMKDFGIDRLTPAQQIALALEIWESLGEARPSARLTGDQRAELARRDAELDANPSSGLSLEQLDEQLGRRPS